MIQQAEHGQAGNQQQEYLQQQQHQQHQRQQLSSGCLENMEATFCN
jgi:hypothetical protein